jgi:hypothetical protein
MVNCPKFTTQGEQGGKKQQDVTLTDEVSIESVAIADCSALR